MKKLFVLLMLTTVQSYVVGSSALGSLIKSPTLREAGKVGVLSGSLGLPGAFAAFMAKQTVLTLTNFLSEKQFAAELKKGPHATMFFAMQASPQDNKNGGQEHLDKIFQNIKDTALRPAATMQKNIDFTWNVAVAVAALWTLKKAGTWLLEQPAPKKSNTKKKHSPDDPVTVADFVRYQKEVVGPMGNDIKGLKHFVGQLVSGAQEEVAAQGAQETKVAVPAEAKAPAPVASAAA